jgi:protein-tyrosine-phosphatase
MAHAIFADEVRKRSLAVTVYSAGVYDFSDAPRVPETSDTCRQHNTPAPEKAPTFAGQLPLDSIDCFLVMEQHHADVLTREFGISPERVSLLGTFDPHRRGSEIADPFGQGKLVYERSYQLIRDCIIGYLDATEEMKRSDPPAVAGG